MVKSYPLAPMPRTPSEKPATRSKKFVMCCIVESFLFLMYQSLVVLQPADLPVSTVLVTIVIAMGFIGAGYVIGVAALDYFVELFKNGQG